MRVGLDLDGVCYRWSEATIRALEEHRGYAPGELEVSKYWNHIQEQIKAADWEWLWRGPGCTKMFGYVDEFYPGVPRGMRRLAAMSDLVVITHRPRISAPTTAAWLAAHRVHFESLHVLGAHIPKSTVRPQCDVYIEDKPENVEDLLYNTDGVVLVPRRPFNEEWLETHSSRRMFPYKHFKEAVQWVRARA